jgi:hypothetical protein
MADGRDGLASVPELANEAVGVGVVGDIKDRTVTACGARRKERRKEKSALERTRKKEKKKEKKTNRRRRSRRNPSR